jgi:hypothetical protein
MEIMALARRNRGLEVSWLHDPVSHTAQLLAEAQQYPRAEATLTQYLDALEKGAAAEAGLVVELRLQLVDIYLLHEKQAHAIAQLQRIVRLLRRAYGEDAPRLEEVRARLAELRGNAAQSDLE